MKITIDFKNFNLSAINKILFIKKWSIKINENKLQKCICVQYNIILENYIHVLLCIYKYIINYKAII